jgi:excisionase family DNA binding protein
VNVEERPPLPPWLVPRSELLTVGELAARLKVSLRTVRRLQAAGKLSPRVGKGRHKMYKRGDIEALLPSLPVRPPPRRNSPAESSAAG